MHWLSPQRSLSPNFNRCSRICRATSRLTRCISDLSSSHGSE